MATNDSPPPPPPDDRPECRICRGEEDSAQDRLVAPCACAGSMRFVHEQCLLRWLRHSQGALTQTPICSVCQQPFQGLRVPTVLEYARSHGRALWRKFGSRAALGDTLLAGARHVVHPLLFPNAPPAEPHPLALAVRWAGLLGVLQLGVWQAQCALCAFYWVLLWVLHVDDSLDKLLLPESVLSMVHRALPPVCHLAPLRIGFAAAADKPPATASPPPAPAHGGGDVLGSVRRAAAAVARHFDRPPAPPIADPALTAGLGELGILSIVSTLNVADWHRAVWEARVPNVLALLDAIRQCILDDSQGDSSARVYRATAPAALASPVVRLGDVRMTEGVAAMRAVPWLPVWGATIDVLLIAAILLRLNARLIARLLERFGAPLNAWLRLARDAVRPLTRPLPRALAPPPLPAEPIDAFVSAAVHVPSAVYVARLVLAALGVLPLSRCTLDFGTGDGVALHVFLGLLAVCAWRAAQAAVNALFDDFAAWRWSMGAVARADHNRA